jgi:hypothetical protein
MGADFWQLQQQLERQEYEREHSKSICSSTDSIRASTEGQQQPVLQKQVRRPVHVRKSGDRRTPF